MATLLDFIRVDAYIVVLGMAAAVGYRLLHAAVRSRGFLNGIAGTPSATTLLLVTLGGAVYLVAQAAAGADSLEIPGTYLYLLGGCSMVQIASKTRVLRRVRRIFSLDSAMKE